MKIIKTKEKTEIKISVIELRMMLIAKDGRIKESASEILKSLKEINSPKKEYNYKKDFDDAIFNLYSGCSEDSEDDGFVHHKQFFPWEQILKTDDDIRKEEREKVVGEVDDIIWHHTFDSNLYTSVRKLRNKILSLIDKKLKN